MSRNLNAEKSPTFSLQLGKDLISLMETKLPIVNIYSEVGMTDWEIHMNQTMHLLENDCKIEIKKPEPVVIKKVENVELKNARQYSGFWFA